MPSPGLGQQQQAMYQQQPQPGGVRQNAVSKVMIKQAYKLQDKYALQLDKLKF